MSHIIYKYDIHVQMKRQELTFPGGSRLLSCQLQDDDLKIWVQQPRPFDTASTHSFYVVGTGHDIDFDVKRYPYFATVQVGWFVWHIYTDMLRV
jgi:hypothetical protein